MAKVIYGENRNDNTNESTLSIFVVGSGKPPISLHSKHPSYDEVKAYCQNVSDVESKDAQEVYEDIKKMSDYTEVLGKKMATLSPRIKFDGTDIYYDGDNISQNSLTASIVKAYQEDKESIGSETTVKSDDYSLKSLVAFMDKLYSNKINSAKESLYDFLKVCGLKITEDGNFIAFKGVNKDYLSRYSGEGIVNGVYFSHAHLDNSVGNLVEFPRNKVVLDRNRYCDIGLHAGTYEYASSYAGKYGRVILVEIDPRDVISVPYDYNGSKMRVCRYKVIADLPAGSRTSSFVGEDSLVDRMDEYDDETVSCEFCLAEIDPDDAERNASGDIMCRDCYDDDDETVYCDFCLSEIEPDDESRIVFGDTICSHCYDSEEKDHSKEDDDSDEDY